MKCLALYGLGPGWRFGPLYTALRQHLRTSLRNVKKCKVVAGDWPRAKKISEGDLLDVMYDHNGIIKSIECDLGFSIDQKSDDGYLLISSRPEMLVIGLPDNVEERIDNIEALARNMLHESRFDYGYVFCSNKDNGQALYASGITYIKSGEAIDHVAAADNDRWFNELVLEKNGRRRYRDDGMMRGVYEVNILNVSHLGRMICGEHLSVLIRKNNWGTLDKVTPYNWLWRVKGNALSEAEAHLRSCSVFI